METTGDAGERIGDFEFSEVEKITPVIMIRSHGLRVFPGEILGVDIDIMAVGVLGFQD